MLPKELLAFAREHENDNIHTLALQGNKYPNIEIKAALQQVKGLQVAKHKLPSWYSNQNIIYPPQISLEQCSSEQTASYKQSLCKDGQMMVDLTGGLGVDTSFLSKSFDETVYVERQGDLANVAQSNFEALSLSSIEVINADATDYLDRMESVDFVYIDPARRDNKGRKTVLIEDCTPNIVDIQPNLDVKAKRGMIKLSPMLDIWLALQSLTNVIEIHVVSVDNECKELLFIKEQNNNTCVPVLHCVNITSKGIDRFSFTRSEEESTVRKFASKLGKYLYEPNASIMKAGAYKSIGSKHELDKLHVNSHLYTSDTFVESFPGKKFKIQDVSSLNKNELKKSLANLNKANVVIRNFPMKPEILADKIGISNGGDTYIYGTTLHDNSKVLIICERL